MKILTRPCYAPTALILLASQQAVAGGIGLSTVVSWAPLSVSAVPTLGTWTLGMLAALLIILALRTLRGSPHVVRSVLTVAFVGVAGGGLFWMDKVTSQPSGGFFQIDDCQGSSTFINNTELINRCGETVVLSVDSCPSGAEYVCEAASCLGSGDTLENDAQGIVATCDFASD